MKSLNGEPMDDDVEVTSKNGNSIISININVDTHSLRNLFRIRSSYAAKTLKNALTKAWQLSKSYSFWRFLVELLMYFSLTLLLITSIKIAAYLPVVTKYNFQKLGPSAEPKGGLGIFKISVDNPANVYALSHDLGLNYPPFLLSILGLFVSGIILISFFPQETKTLDNFKKCLLFIFTLFGILITLFSIWGA